MKRAPQTELRVSRDNKKSAINLSLCDVVGETSVLFADSSRFNTNTARLQLPLSLNRLGVIIYKGFNKWGENYNCPNVIP